MPRPVETNRLEDWSLVRKQTRCAPEDRGTLCICGRKRGKLLTTTPITGITIKGTVVTESGYRFELGEPNAEYAACFPDAKRRLFKTCPIVE